MKDLIMTPGNTPLPRALTIEPPLLGHRYLPVSIAGDGAFSRTIIAQDVLNPHKPMVAIKAMKPGFEAIGQQVHSNDATTNLGIQIVTTNTKPTDAKVYESPYCPSIRLVLCVIDVPSCPRGTGARKVMSPRLSTQSELHFCCRLSISTECAAKSRITVTSWIICTTRPNGIYPRRHETREYPSLSIRYVRKTN
jgi:hypothetical protein